MQRGKFFPQLTNLVRINTPKAVQTESRKAFRKLPNVEQAISTLTNLKGVGTTLASGLLQTLGLKSWSSIFFLFTHCLLIFCIGYFSFCTWLSQCLIFSYFYVVHFHISLMSLFKITTQLLHTTHWVFFICTAFIAWTKILPKVAWTLIFWCIPYWFI